MIPDEEEDEIVSYNIETIQEINELCMQNGGILLLYSAPSWNELLEKYIKAVNNQK